MFTMAVGHSDDPDPQEAVAIAIDQCRRALAGRPPRAGILFSALDSFDRSIVADVLEAFPGVEIMGSTSSAELSSAGGFKEDSVALALFASDVVDVTVGLGSGLGEDAEGACRSAADQALSGTTREPKVCIVLAEAFVMDPQRTLNAMARALPEGVVIVGGGSARADFFSTRAPTFQFCNERVASDGVAVLLFSGPLAFSIAVGTGWKPIGPTGIVTSSAFGALEGIDGRPALEFLARYLDVTGPDAYGNPLAVMEAGTDESYLRVIQGSNAATGSVVLSGLIPVGATVQLTTGDTDAILSGTRAALVRASEGFPAGSNPEAALIFSCAVRKFVLGSRTQVETELARSVLGPSVALAGMYCSGEISPVRGAPTSRLLQESFVTLLLGT
jgi:hypothetical protein